MLTTLRSLFAPKLRAIIVVRGAVTRDRYDFQAQCLCRDLNLLGWMRVIPHSLIEIDVEGPKPRLDKLLNGLRTTARGQVTGIEVSYAPYKGAYHHFRVRV
jgi:acylphosphatase